MYINGGRNNSKIKFALEDQVFLIERLQYVDIVGDIRNKNDPNYCEIALSRTYRLSVFYQEFILRKCFNFLNHF